MNDVKFSLPVAHSYSWSFWSFFQELFRHVIVLAVLPPFFLLGGILVSYVAHNALVYPLILLNLLGLVTIGRWRLFGLILSALLMIGMFIWVPDRSYSVVWGGMYMGSCLLNLGMTYLFFEEIRAVVRGYFEVQQKDRQECCTLQEELLQEQRVHVEQYNLLNAEIQKLKEEAEQRNIEQHELSQHLLFARSEIELLTSQKEQIVRASCQVQKEYSTDSIDGKAALEESLKVSQSQVQCLKTQISILEKDKIELTVLIDSLNASLEARPRSAEISSQSDNIPELARVQGLYKQLRMQFLEKSQVLDQTRQQVFKLEGVCEAHNIERFHDQIRYIEAEGIQLLILELDELLSETHRLNREIKELESFISFLIKEE